MHSPWFLSCALVALSTTGIVPILVPLEIVQVQGHPGNVGLVMATIGAGMLTSPLWAGLAARFGCYRLLISAACAGVGLALVGFDLCHELWEWVGFAFLTGCSVAATFTLANIVILAQHPDDAERRISWLQTWVTAGTVLGLAVAGAVEHLSFQAGVWAGGLTSLLAMLVAWASLPAHLRPPPPREQASAEVPSRSLGPLGPLLALWFLSNAGVSGYTAYYPLVMQAEFQVSPSTASYVMAAASALSTPMFAWAGHLVSRLGPRNLLLRSLVLRLAALILLSLLSYTQFRAREWVALSLFSAVTLLWPLISVAATLLAARLASSSSRGLGYFDGAAALAHLVGPVVAGVLANQLGYEAVLVFAAVSLALSLLFRPTPA
jgi:MFS family permease